MACSESFSNFMAKGHLAAAAAVSLRAFRATRSGCKCLMSCKQNMPGSSLPHLVTVCKLLMLESFKSSIITTIRRAAAQSARRLQAVILACPYCPGGGLLRFWLARHEMYWLGVIHPRAQDKLLQSHSKAIKILITNPRRSAPKLITVGAIDCQRNSSSLPRIQEDDYSLYSRTPSNTIPILHNIDQASSRWKLRIHVPLLPQLLLAFHRGQLIRLPGTGGKGFIGP